MMGPWWTPADGTGWCLEEIPSCWDKSKQGWFQLLLIRWLYQTAPDWPRTRWRTPLVPLHGVFSAGTRRCTCSASLSDQLELWWETANGWVIVPWSTLRGLKAVKAKSKQTKNMRKTNGQKFLVFFFFLQISFLGAKSFATLVRSAISSRLVAGNEKKRNETEGQKSFNCVQMMCWWRTNSGGTSDQTSVHESAKIKYAVFGRLFGSKASYINSNQTSFPY